MKNKQVIIVNPWFTDFKGYDEWMSPLGVLYLSSALKENGITTHVINCVAREYEPILAEKKYGTGAFLQTEIEKPPLYSSIPRKYKRYGISKSELEKKLRALPKPDLIAVGSMMTYWYLGVFDTIEVIRQVYPETQILLGGIYTILTGEHAAKYGRKRGLLKDGDLVLNRVDLESTVEIFSQILEVTRRHHYSTLSEYPFPDYEAIAPCYSIALNTSIGCPFRCTYCASRLLSPKLERHDPLRLADLTAEFLQKHTCKNIAFYDDALLLNYDELLLPFLKRLTSKVEGLNFHTPNAMHAKFIDLKRAEQLKALGFKTLRIGYEFYDSKRKSQSGGKVSNENILNCTKALRRAGFCKSDVGMYIIYGAPNVTTEEIRNGIEECYALGVKSMLTEYSPIPKTEMWTQFPNSNTEIATDPLFHNNTYHTYNGSVLPYSDYKFLKELSNRLNAKLE